MLMPKRVKHRKQMRGSRRGNTKGGANVAFGGLYEVETLTVNGVDRPPLLSDAWRWRHVTVNRYWLAFVRMDGTREAYGHQTDTAKKTLVAFIKHQGEYAWRPFEEVKRPAVPKSAPAWVRNPVDAFIAAEHDKQNDQDKQQAHSTLSVSVDISGSRRLSGNPTHR